jgi:predicted lactoylglutathione lyase
MAVKDLKAATEWYGRPLAVDAIDEMIAHARKLGIDTSKRTANTRVKTLMIVDPDGNHIAFAQALDDRMAR